MSWLLSTLFDSILSRVVTCCHSFQVWNAICSHFHGLTCARTTQLRLELRIIKNGNKSCSEYLQRIQQLCDTLTTTGDAISNREQTDTILDIETMILAYEARLEQPKQTALQESLTLNLAESTLAPCSVPANMPENHVVANYVSTQGAATANSTLFSLNQNQYSSQGNFPVNSDGYGRGQNCGRGAQGCGGQVQCQIYKKRGHEASTCYHRSAVAPFGNFGSPYSFFGPSFSGPSFSQIGSYGFQLQHSFAPPNFGALQVFGNMQQPHFANGTTPTPWMPYLPGPHFQNPAPPFGYQPPIPPNNGTTLQQQQIPPTANIS
ncbi:hypothetical protein JHK85_012292 [Glycine max]|nr:hypothetical protein JHK85_012292 [Glycine max]